jgi:septal ring factor EnvC (AmiA/AmiB activator)
MKKPPTGVPGILPLLCCAVLAAVLLSCPPAGAAENPKEEYQRLQKELERRKERLSETKRREHSVLDELDAVGRRLRAVEDELKKNRERLSQTQATIRAVERDISANQRDLEKKREWMKRKLRVLQRYGQLYELLFLVSDAEDFAQLTRRIRYLERVAVFERKVINSYIANLRQLDEKGKQLKHLQAELSRDEERVKVTEATLLERKKDREQVLTMVRTEKASQEKMVRELQESARRLRDVIKRLEEKDTFEAKGFAEAKGRLSWPVSGKIVVPYGSQKDPKFNTPVFRNGVYIKADEDSVRAVYGGKVVFAEWFKGYGNLLIVNHGEGYHTLYANLSEIFFRVGDIIKIHDVVGRAGDSGIVTAPSLYFEVRYKGKPLNPAQWLKRR